MTRIEQSVAIVGLVGSLAGALAAVWSVRGTTDAILERADRLSEKVTDIDQRVHAIEDCVHCAGPIAPYNPETIQFRTQSVLLDSTLTLKFASVDACWPMLPSRSSPTEFPPWVRATASAPPY